MSNSASEVDWFGDETGHVTDYQDTWRLDDPDDNDFDDLDDFDDVLDAEDDERRF